MKKQFKHQGDIPLYPFNGEIAGEVQKHNGSFTIAWGEATGHHHTIHVAHPDDMEIVKTDGGWILTLKSEGTIKHQEHLPITLAPGVYRTGHEREVDWFAEGVARKVID